VLTRRQLTRIVTGCVALFGSIALTGLLSPVGAVHDEFFHASSIWCAQGERSPYCEKITPSDEVGAFALTNIDSRVCQTAPDRPLVCPTERTGTMSLFTNAGLYPGAFYRTMSNLVFPSVEVSVILIRWVNALVVIGLIAAALMLLPRRHRTALVLTMLGIFNPFPLYLFGSLNPSSWLIIGVVVGWLCCDAAVSREDLSRRMRWALMALSVIAWLLAIGSRWDAVPYIAFTVALTAVHAVWVRFGTRALPVAFASTTAAGAAVIAIDWLTPFSAWGQVRQLFVYSSGQPDNTAFVTHYLLHGIPKALDAFGEVPTMTGIFLPRLVYVANAALLGGILLASRARRSVMQVLGVLVTWVAVSAVLMAHHSGMDDRDPFGPSTRYVLPLTAFAVAWWCVHAPTDVHQRLSSYVRFMRVAIVGSFALSAWTIAERFVDAQTFGLRYLPEGPDQWWWDGAPVGPNVVVFAASLFMFIAVWQLTTLFTDQTEELTA
jgi:hypothetical protein